MGSDRIELSALADRLKHVTIDGLARFAPTELGTATRWL